MDGECVPGSCSPFVCIFKPMLKNVNKYRVLEVSFFVAVFFAFPILTDVEYALNENPRESFGYSLTLRLVNGCFAIWPWVIFYQLIIKRVLLRKKYLQFLLLLPVFLACLELYTVNITYTSISRMTFLPELSKTYAQYLQAKVYLHFSIIYVLVQTLIFIALAYFIHASRQQKQLEQLQRAKLETDLNYLRAQLQPHFFFNTLNNIYSMALQQSRHTAPLVAKLSDMMRYVLYESEKEKVPVTEEIAFLANYIEVQSVRYSDKIDIRFDTQGLRSDVMIEPMLLLPFVENAFKHGVEDEASDGFIDIVVCLTGNELTISARNSKPRIAPVEPKGGIGLTNTGKRLSLLYPQRHSMSVVESPQEYSVCLTLHLS
jgi:sensor histidine kinase YesM